MTNFNSIKVQLELSVPPVKGKYFDFNSIKVQLEPVLPRAQYGDESDFNSIKVQLERRPSLLYPIFVNQISIP